MENWRGLLINEIMSLIIWHNRNIEQLKNEDMDRLKLIYSKLTDFGKGYINDWMIDNDLILPMFE